MSRATHQHARPTKILVIEDDEGIRGNLLEMLELAGYTSVGAADGYLGVDLALQCCPDLIICDINMPGLDGYEVLEALRAHSDTAKVPIVFLSACADAKHLRRGRALGAADYITKPFTRVKLLDSIRMHLPHAQEHDERESVRPDDDGDA